MHLDFHWVNVLVLFGAVQGVVFAGILLFHKNHPGRLFLVLAMLALVYNALETFNWSAGLNKYITFFDFFPYVTIFLIGPGFYLYFKSLLIPGFLARRKEILLLFSPFLFQFFYSLIKIIGYSAYFLLDWKSLEIPLTYLFQIYTTYSEIWSLVVFLFFTFLAISLVRKNNKANPANFRRKEISNWVMSLLVFQLILAIGWTMTLLAPLWYTGQGAHYYPIESFLVVFLYWVTLAGFVKVKAIQKADTPISKETNPEAFETLELLQMVMKNKKLFLNPNLNLQTLADHLSITPKEISYALNQAGNMNFNDFVNSYRIADFCERMISGAKSNLTNFAIAQECGFQSPATFQRAFKKAKGMSPKAFLTGKSIKKEKV